MPIDKLAQTIWKMWNYQEKKVRKRQSFTLWLFQKMQLRRLRLEYLHIVDRFKLELLRCYKSHLIIAFKFKKNKPIHRKYLWKIKLLTKIIIEFCIRKTVTKHVLYDTSLPLIHKLYACNSNYAWNSVFLTEKTFEKRGVLITAGSRNFVESCS